MISTLKREKSLSELIPLLNIEQDQYITPDGHAAVAFEVLGHEMEMLTAMEYQAFNQHLANTLSALPLGTNVQKYDIFYQMAYEGDRKKESFIGRSQVEHFYHRKLLLQKSYLVFSLGHLKQRKVNAVSSGQVFLKSPLKDLDKRMAYIEQQAHEVITFLTGQGITTRKLQDEELRNFYLQYINLEFDPAQQPTDVNRQVSRHPNGVALGEKDVRVVSLTGQGAYVEHAARNKKGIDSPYTYPLLHDLDFPHIVVTTWRVEDNEKELQTLDNAKRNLTVLGTWATQDNAITQTEIDEFTAEVRINHTSLVSLNVAVILWHIDTQQLQRHVEATVAAFRQMAGAEAWVESLDSLPLFFANAPGNGFHNYRWLLLTAENAAAYLNFTTQYQSDAEGVLLCDRYGQPLRVNLFNTYLNNQNKILVGPSGSGKSYTFGYFIIQFFLSGDRILVIDIGGTYKHVFLALEGTYFDYDPEHPIAFNPLNLDQDSQGNYLLTGDKLTFLIAFFSTLWKGRSEASLTQTERAILAELIPKFYEQMDQDTVPTLEWFALWLRQYDLDMADDAEYKKVRKHFDVDGFLLTLRPFTHGEYKQVLNAEENIDISQHRLVGFDLAKVKSNPILYPIVSMIIVELALDQIRKFPQARKHLVMDEAWNLLSGETGEFVELSFRTIRKNRGAMTIITQGIAEITNSDIGAAIIANTDTKMVLKHTDPKQVARVTEAFGLTHHEQEKINSLRVMERSRELFIRMGEYGKVFSLEVSPAIDAILSSKPSERDYLHALIDVKPNIEAALLQYLEDKAKEKGGHHGTD